MARGVNKVILIGNLGNDPEVRYTPNGNAVANISLATSESWRDKQSGELQDRTEWHRVVFFNRLAEIVGEYLRKGSKIYVEGALRTRKWADKSGVERYTTEIIANEMQMLDSKNGGATTHSEKFNSQPQYPTEQGFANQSNYNTSNKATTPTSGGDQSHEPPQHAEPAHISDDDIPF